MQQFGDVFKDVLNNETSPASIYKVTSIGEVRHLIGDCKKLPNGYWDYEKCKEESKKYTGRKEFQKGNSSAYNTSLKNNWLDDFTWLISKRKPVKHLETGKVYLTLVAGCNKTETPYKKEHGKLYKSSKTKQFKYITIEEYDRLKDK